MFPKLSPLAVAAPLLLSALPRATAILGLDALAYIPVCKQISAAISSASDVYFRRTLNYFVWYTLCRLGLSGVGLALGLCRDRLLDFRS